MDDTSLTNVLTEFGGHHEPSTDIMAHLRTIVAPPLVPSDFEEHASLESIRFIFDLVGEVELRLINRQDETYLKALREQQSSLVVLNDAPMVDSIAHGLFRAGIGKNEKSKKDAYQRILAMAEQQLPAFEWKLPLALIASTSTLRLLGGPSRPHVATDMLTIAHGEDQERVHGEVRTLVGSADGEITPIDIAYHRGISYYVLDEDPSPFDPTVIATGHAGSWQPGTMSSHGPLSAWLRASFVPSHEMPALVAPLIDWYQSQDKSPG